MIQNVAGILRRDKTIQHNTLLDQGADMFNSTIIDVAIGMVLSFLAVSLAASAITEAISSVLQLRQKTLANGIQALLNYHPQDHPLALDLYKSSLISPLTSGTATSFEDIKHKPAYIDSRQFALAFYNALEKKTPQAAVGQTPSTDDVIRMITDPQLKNAIEALWGISAKDVDAFKHNIAVWFDNSMDRHSGWHKRWTRF
jgi:hypothetical protein